MPYYATEYGAEYAGPCLDCGRHLARVVARQPIPLCIACQYATNARRVEARQIVTEAERLTEAVAWPHEPTSPSRQTARP